MKVNQVAPTNAPAKPVASVACSKVPVPREFKYFAKSQKTLPKQLGECGSQPLLEGSDSTVE